MKTLFSILALSLAPIIVHAGDACPIQINIRDLGVPSWLDRDALLSELQIQHPFIGIRHMDTDAGIELTYIHPDSAAAAANLRQGDVVTAINGVPTTNIDAREAVFDSKQPGDQLTFTRINQGDVTLTVGHTDPVPLGMSNAIRQQDCRVSQLSTADSAERDQILPMLFSENRGFRCYDAHIALQTLGEFHEISDVYIVRGSRRILITMPYWGTACLSVSSVDGENYTAANLLAAVDEITNRYAQFNIENP